MFRRLRRCHRSPHRISGDWSRRLGLALAAPGLLVAASPPAAAEAPSFLKDVAPVLRKHCLACHGPEKSESGYRVDTYRRFMSAGDTGEVIVSGSAEQSELVRRLTTEDTEDRMPAEAPALSEEVVRKIARWIDDGAKFDGDDPDAPLPK